MDKYKVFITKGIAEAKTPKLSEPPTPAVRDTDTDTNLVISTVSSPGALPHRTQPT